MTIAATCPDCGARYNLNDALEGQQVRCKRCQCPFFVRPSAVRPAADRVLGEALPARPRQADDLEEAQPVVRRTGVSPVVWVLVGGGVVILTLAGVCAGLFYRAMRSGGEAVDELVANVKQNQPGFEPFNPFWVPRDVNEALAHLQAPDRPRRIAAADWLARQPVDPGRRADVARALEPLLEDLDGGVRVAGMRGLEAWGGAENVPAVVRMLEGDPAGFEGDECRRRGMDLIVRLKDVRGAPGVARGLKQPFDRERARRALEKLGSGAESAVLPYLKDNDWGARVEACKTLKAIGTKRSLPDLRATLEGTKAMYGGYTYVRDSAQEAIDAINARGR
jgi:hypothetical protein